MLCVFLNQISDTYSHIKKKNTPKNKKIKKMKKNKTSKNHGCGGIDQPKSWPVMCVLPYQLPFQSPMQAATVALADPGLIPVTLLND